MNNQLINDDDLYDEFGNYIGPELEDDDDDSSQNDHLDNDDLSDVSREEQSQMIVGDSDHHADTQEETAEPMDAIVLHEDKEYYPSASTTFGEDVRTAVLEEDTMDIETQPIVEPVTVKSHKVPDEERHGTATTSSPWNYSEDYLAVQIANETTRTRRGVAVVGHLHHGKTSLIDLVLEPTRTASWGTRASLQEGQPRYTDTLKAEQERQMSLVSTPITTLLPDTRGKSYCITMMDCPGHTNFHDESVAAFKAMDGAVIVVDVVEGIMMHTEMLVKQAIKDGLPMVLVLSKMDRLIVELKLPPRDAYFQILHILEEMNQLVATTSTSRTSYPKFSPSLGNVAFSSAQHGWMFTLQSFAEVYFDHTNSEDGLGTNLSVEEFAKRLWGDSFLDPTTRTFHKSTRDCSAKGVERTFVDFVLKPLYKIYSACLGENEKDVNKLLRSLGVLLSKEQLRSSARPLLRTALSKFLATASNGFTDMIVKFIPCPVVSATGKVARCYSGALDSHTAKAMLRCDPNGPLVIHVVKMYASSDGQSFLSFGRIYSGTVRPAQQIRVLGESFSVEDDEDSATATVENVSIPRGRGRTNISVAKAGNWVLLEGVDAIVAKTATIVSASSVADDIAIFSPLQFPYAGGESVMKLAIEPVQPAELPKMIEGLRRVSKAYPMARTKVEESGEHVILATGEQYMDCVLHDLRHVYSDVEVKLSDPIVAFRETVTETSSIRCFSETVNKRNRLGLIAEPLDEGLAERLEWGKVNPNWDKKKLGRFFQTEYDWDLLASRSVWAFGDSPTRGTNILMDDTLPSEVNKSLLAQCKSSIVQGFQWATREGPLCEEPVRGTKLKILDATLADKPIHRGGGQMIPTARRAVHASLLTATPRLMEPIFRLQIQCPTEISSDALHPVIARRRGHVIQDKPISGSTFHSLTGYMPLLDSFGFETDLRTFSQGQAMVYSVFDHWAVVPGDPLDRSIVFHPLEPSPPHMLAREILLKTRRRKGLSEDVSIGKFVSIESQDILQ